MSLIADMKIAAALVNKGDGVVKVENTKSRVHTDREGVRMSRKDCFDNTLAVQFLSGRLR